MAERIIVKGGSKLDGRIRISGSKNASLPLLAATILSDKAVTIKNLPHLADIATMSQLLLSFGMELNFIGHGDKSNSRGRSIICDASNINNYRAEYDIVSKMRASILVLGPLVAKYGKAIVSLPGGCAIGARPVNFHIKALEQLGATIEIKEGYLHAAAPQGLTGAEITFPKISVGATENTLMAASLAKGTTILHNAAIEPEIIDLINLLKSMGAKITQEGRSITIEGVETLAGSEYQVCADRIEAGSYAVAALATRGKIFFPELKADIFTPIKEQLVTCGALISETEAGVTVAYQEPRNKIDEYFLETTEFPGFPTDMQAQFAALLGLQNFKSRIRENIFENRFMHVSELSRMGADIQIEGNELAIAPAKLSGTEVNASDLRASMALVIAALTAQGTTTIYKTHHLDRGYELLVEKLSNAGANIYRELY